jgi:hypothetical protein
LAQLDYTPATLANTINIAQRVAVSPDTIRNLKLIPYLFPQATMNAIATGWALYNFLPVETTFKIVPQ